MGTKFVENCKMSKITLLGLVVMVITLPDMAQSGVSISKRSAQDSRFFFGNNNSGRRPPPPRRGPPGRGGRRPPGRRPGGPPQQSSPVFDASNPLLFGGAALAGGLVGAGTATLLG